jgi:lipoprotein-releasing system ATP-binding protein
MNEVVLSATGLAKSYVNGPRRADVLQGLELIVGTGEAVAIVGDSGVGKSTLLHLLGALDRPDRGEVRFRGADIAAFDTEQRANYRNRHVGFVFQFHHLLPEFSALENVELPRRIGRADGTGLAEAQALLERLGLGARLTHRPAEMSGGERQRVAVARALINGPAVVLADEPTGNLDPHTGAEVFRLMRLLQHELAYALVLVTHSARLARSCDRVLRLEGGGLHPLGGDEARLYFAGSLGAEG